MSAAKPGFHSSTDDVLAGVDLTGKFVIVTGGSSGLGEETARAVASAGAEVLISARDPARGDASVARIGDEVPGARISCEIMALDDLESVRRFAEAVLRVHPRIDILINNAGIMATPFSRTRDGFESQLGTNHLSHFLLTALLMPALLRAAPARVISVASAGHHMSDILWDDPNFERRAYDKWLGYGQSKTANILFAIELSRLWADKGVKAYAVHPGAIRTGLSVHFSPDDRAAINQMVDGAGAALEMKTIPQGAASTVWAATAPELEAHAGAYIEDCGISGPGEPGSFAGQAPWAMDGEAATRLWGMSERLIARGEF